MEVASQWQTALFANDYLINEYFGIYLITHFHFHDVLYEVMRSVVVN